MDSLQVVEYVMSGDIFLIQTMFVVAFLVLAFKFVYEVTKIAALMAERNGYLKQVTENHSASSKKHIRTLEIVDKAFQGKEKSK